MRTIKFRAWHKKQKYMQEVDGCDLYLAAGQIYKERCVGWEGSDMVVTDEYELMQFTGLLDKKGKEIYEGDILKVDGIYGSDDFEVRSSKGAFDIHSEKQTITDLLFFHHQGNLEVIGNIYANPELL